MQCTVFEQYIQNKISDEDFDLHLLSCKHCQAMNKRFESAYAILDGKVELPEKLIEKTLARRDKNGSARSLRVDFSTISQLAAVLVAGVFLGIQLGRNSDTNLLKTRESRKQQSLIEYRNDHYFNVKKELFY